VIRSRSDQLFDDQVRQGLGVDLPEGPELHKLALEIICSKGISSHLTPYGSIRSIAAYAIGQTDDAFYRDGERLLKACVAAREEGQEP
jgi:hypothetical protein